MVIFNKVKKEEDTNPIQPNTVMAPKHEPDAFTILHDVWDREDDTMKIAKKVTFFGNLVYLIGVIFFGYFIYLGAWATVLPVFAVVSVGLFAFNAMLYWLTKCSMKRRDNAYQMYTGFEYRRTHAKK